MNSKMQVLYIKQTGHILAAFTRTADPEGKPSFLPAQESDNRSLLVRDPAGFNSVLNANIAFSVPATVVEQTVIGFKAEVFAAPMKYTVTTPDASEITDDGVVKINSLTISKIVIEVEVRLPNGNIDPAGVSDDTKVWVQLEQASPTSGNDPIRRVMQEVIKKKDSSNTSDGKSVTLKLRSRPDDPNPATIPTGDYYVLVLVAGRMPLFDKKTAT